MQCQNNNHQDSSHLRPAGHLGDRGAAPLASPFWASPMRGTHQPLTEREARAQGARRKGTKALMRRYAAEATEGIAILNAKLTEGMTSTTAKATGHIVEAVAYQFPRASRYACKQTGRHIKGAAGRTAGGTAKIYRRVRYMRAD